MKKFANLMSIIIFLIGNCILNCNIVASQSQITNNSNSNNTTTRNDTIILTANTTTNQVDDNNNNNSSLLLIEPLTERLVKESNLQAEESQQEALFVTAPAPTNQQNFDNNNVQNNKPKQLVRNVATYYSPSSFSGGSGNSYMSISRDGSNRYEFGFDTGKQQAINKSLGSADNNNDNNNWANGERKRKEPRLMREETRLEDGTVIGRYGYTDPFNVFRIVQYVAGPDGYFATEDVGAVMDQNNDGLNAGGGGKFQLNKQLQKAIEQAKAQRLRAKRKLVDEKQQHNNNNNRKEQLQATTNYKQATPQVIQKRYLETTDSDLVASSSNASNQQAAIKYATQINHVVGANGVSYATAFRPVISNQFLTSQQTTAPITAYEPVKAQINIEALQRQHLQWEERRSRLPAPIYKPSLGNSYPVQQQDDFILANQEPASITNNAYTSNQPQYKQQHHLIPETINSNVDRLESSPAWSLLNNNYQQTSSSLFIDHKGAANLHLANVPLTQSLLNQNIEENFQKEANILKSLQQNKELDRQQQRIHRPTMAYNYNSNRQQQQPVAVTAAPGSTSMAATGKRAEFGARGNHWATEFATPTSISSNYADLALKQFNPPLYSPEVHDTSSKNIYDHSVAANQEPVVYSSTVIHSEVAAERDYKPERIIDSSNYFGDLQKSSSEQKLVASAAAKAVLLDPTKHSLKFTVKQSLAEDEQQNLANESKGKALILDGSMFDLSKATSNETNSNESSEKSFTTTINKQDSNNRQQQQKDNDMIQATINKQQTRNFINQESTIAQPTIVRYATRLTSLTNHNQQSSKSEADQDLLVEGSEQVNSMTNSNGTTTISRAKLPDRSKKLSSIFKARTATANNGEVASSSASLRIRKPIPIDVKKQRTTTTTSPISAEQQPSTTSNINENSNVSDNSTTANQQVSIEFSNANLDNNKEYKINITPLQQQQQQQSQSPTKHSVYGNSANGARRFGGKNIQSTNDSHELDQPAIYASAKKRPNLRESTTTTTTTTGKPYVETSSASFENNALTKDVANVLQPATIIDTMNPSAMSSGGNLDKDLLEKIVKIQREIAAMTTPMPSTLTVIRGTTTEQPMITTTPGANQMNEQLSKSKLLNNTEPTINLPQQTSTSVINNIQTSDLGANKTSSTLQGASNATIVKEVVPESSTTIKPQVNNKLDEQTIIGNTVVVESIPTTTTTRAEPQSTTITSIQPVSSIEPSTNQEDVNKNKLFLTGPLMAMDASMDHGEFLSKLTQDMDTFDSVRKQSITMEFLSTNKPIVETTTQSATSPTADNQNNFNSTKVQPNETFNQQVYMTTTNPPILISTTTNSSNQASNVISNISDLLLSSRQQETSSEYNKTTTPGSSLILSQTTAAPTTVTKSETTTTTVEPIKSTTTTITTVSPTLTIKEKPLRKSFGSSSGQARFGRLVIKRGDKVVARFNGSEPIPDSLIPIGGNSSDIIVPDMPRLGMRKAFKKRVSQQAGKLESSTSTIVSTTTIEPIISSGSQPSINSTLDESKQQKNSTAAFQNSTQPNINETLATDPMVAVASSLSNNIASLKRPSFLRIPRKRGTRSYDSNESGDLMFSDSVSKPVVAMTTGSTTNNNTSATLSSGEKLLSNKFINDIKTPSDDINNSNDNNTTINRLNNSARSSNSNWSTRLRDNPIMRRQQPKVAKNVEEKKENLKHVVEKISTDERNKAPIAPNKLVTLKNKPSTISGLESIRDKRFRNHRQPTTTTTSTTTTTISPIDQSITMEISRNIESAQTQSLSNTTSNNETLVVDSIPVNKSLKTTTLTNVTESPFGILIASQTQSMSDEGSSSVSSNQTIKSVSFPIKMKASDTKTITTQMINVINAKQDTAKQNNDNKTSNLVNNSTLESIGIVLEQAKENTNQFNLTNSLRSLSSSLAFNVSVSPNLMMKIDQTKPIILIETKPGTPNGTLKESLVEKRLDSHGHIHVRNNQSMTVHVDIEPPNKPKRLISRDTTTAAKSTKVGTQMNLFGQDDIQRISLGKESASKTSTTYQPIDVNYPSFVHETIKSDSSSPSKNAIEKQKQPEVEISTTTISQTNNNKNGPVRMKRVPKMLCIEVNSESFDHISSKQNR